MSLRTSNEDDLQRVPLWATTTLRLRVQEAKEPRSVPVNRNGQPRVVDVANAIFATDSGEQIKSVFWDEEFHRLYHKLKANTLVELVDFQAKGPDQNQKFRVGNQHFELKATPKSDIVVLKHDYRLRGPEVSFAADVEDRCPGRHKISGIIIASFVQMSEVYVGRVEVSDGSTSAPLRISATLREVYPIERHRLVKGNQIALTGDISKTGSTHAMSVRTWQDVELPGKGTLMQTTSSNAAAGHRKGYGVGLPTPSPSRSLLDQSRRESLGSSIGLAEKENRVTQLKHHGSSDSDDVYSPPPRRDYFSSIDILESADFEIDPWHRITGTITENFFLEDGDFVGHVGEVTIEEEDGSSLPIQVKLRCVKNTDEDRLCVDTKISVKGIMRRLEDDELELETGWADVEFANDPYGRHDYDEDDDVANDADREPATAKDLKNLHSSSFLKIVGNVNKKFVPVGVKYEGRVRVRSDGIAMVNVVFDWSDGEEEPQAWILDLHTGSRVEIEGTVHIEGKILVMDAQTCKELEAQSVGDVSKDSLCTPATPTTNNTFTALSSPRGQASGQAMVKKDDRNSDGDELACPRAMMMVSPVNALRALSGDEVNESGAPSDHLKHEIICPKNTTIIAGHEESEVADSKQENRLHLDVSLEHQNADSSVGPAEDGVDGSATATKRKAIKTEKFALYAADLNTKPKRRNGGSAKNPKRSKASDEPAV